MRVTIQNEQVRTFEALSHDRNPIHTDPIYSRSSQFGRPIVYGMCAVLLGLGRWAGGRTFRLNHIQGRFATPLFEGVSYELVFHEDCNRVKVQYLRNNSPQLSFCFAWQESSSTHVRNIPTESPSHFQPLSDAKNSDVHVIAAGWQILNYPYSIRLELLPELLPKLYLQPNQIPLAQLNALMGSSYLVGMEMPGQQALYSSFELEFETTQPSERSAAFEFYKLSAELDPRFNKIVISGHGTGIQSVCFSTFVRPTRVRYDIEEIRQASCHIESFKDTVVFITGATRGFGSVLAKMFALRDANVLVNYRSDLVEAEAIAAEVHPWNLNVFPIAGDVSKATECQQIRAAIDERFGQIDLLVSNAFPQATARSFSQQDSSEFLQFIQQAIAATVTPLHELLPLVPEGGMVLLISTCYTQKPEADYAHYIVAKAGLEGLMRSLALEFPKLKFLTVRPPRMLTDQTNLAYDLSPPVSAVAVGRKVIEVVSQSRGSVGLAEFDVSLK